MGNDRKHLAKVAKFTQKEREKMRRKFIIANDPRRGWFYSFDLYRRWRVRPCAFFMSSYSPALCLINRLDFYSYIVGLHVLLI